MVEELKLAIKIDDATIEQSGKCDEVTHLLP